MRLGLGVRLGPIVGGSSTPEPTNYATDVNDITGAAWAGTASANVNAGNAPDGSPTADQIPTGGSRYQIRAVPALNRRIKYWVKSFDGTPQTFRLLLTEEGVADYWSPDLIATSTWQEFTFTQVHSNVNFNAIAGIVERLGGGTYNVLVWNLRLQAVTA